MAYEIVMPQLSDSMEEGKLIGWKIKPGDRVKTGDVIAEVESDKAIMEVQSFRDGVVKKLMLKEGESAPVGSVIAVIEEEGSKGQEAGESIQKDILNEASKEPEADRKEMKVKESVIEEIFSQKAKEPTGADTSPVPGEASPRARSLAAAYGIDIKSLQKSGAIPRPAHESDIRAYYLRRYFTPKALRLIELYHLDTSIFSKRKKVSESDVLDYIKARDIPLSKPLTPMRKAIVATVTESAKRPVFHIYDSIDGALLEKYSDKNITMSVWLLKLFGESMMRHEGFRTTIGPDGYSVWPSASICLAVSVEEGLYLPVFKGVERKSAATLAKELERIKGMAKQKKITPAMLRGSTFGISNLGMTGIERFDAMINASDSAIAAIGSEKEGKIAVTLTIDHRIVDGMEAARFMQTLKELSLDERFFEKVSKDGD